MKNSFVLYTEYLKHMKLLSLEQRGVLFTAIMCYEMEETLPEMDGMTEMAFSFIKEQLDRDEKTYQEKIQQKSEAGKKGGAPIGNKNAQKQTKQANAYSDYSKQAETSKNNQTEEKQTKQAVHVDVDVDEKEKEYLRTQKEKSDEGEETSPLSAEESRLDENRGKNRKRFIPPTLAEVQAYAKERGRADLAKKFFDYFEAGEWHDSEGKPVKAWKQKFITWETQRPYPDTIPRGESKRPIKTVL